MHREHPNQFAAAAHAGAASISRRRLALIAGSAAVESFPFGSRAATQVAGGKLRVAAWTNPSSLDPMTGRSGFDHVMLYPIFDTLIEFDYATLSPRPGIARAWRYADPTTLVLDLNEGVRFHDDTPCDAAAVKFNLERSAREPKSNVRTDLASVSAIEVTSPLRVTLRLKNPDTGLVMALSDRIGMMVSPTAVQASPAGFDRKPVGAGAWSFVSWTDNSKLVVKRFDKYWRSGRPLLDGIEFTIIPELTTGLRSVVAGENDLVYGLSRQQQVVIDRSEKLQSVSGPTQIINMIYFNLGRAPFNDLRIRQALNYAVDRETFNQITRDGEATRAVLPKEHWACDPSLTKAYPYDPDRAKKLLAEAGHAQGFDLAAIGWNDQKAIQRQELLIESFGKIGVRTRFTTASVADATTQFMQDKRGDAFLGAFTGRPDPSQVFERLFAPDSVINAGRVDPVPGRAAAQLATQASDRLEDRQQAFFALQKLASDNALCLPITVQYDLTAFAKKVVGFRPNLTGKPKMEGVSIAA